MWARHGYEIGQRSNTWSDHGVAPAWLTDNQPSTQQAAAEPERDPIEVHAHDRGNGRGTTWVWRCSGIRHCRGGFIGLDHDSETSARTEADRHAREDHGDVETERQLHARSACPGWEYETTEGPRKAWDDADRPPTDGNGDPDPSWERNVDAGRDGWDRFDYTEESYWRRPVAEPATQVSGVLRLPDDVMTLLRQYVADEGVAGPATQAGES
jgi:hypothetical protein